MSVTTSNLQVSMIVPVCEQRFWQLSQVGLEYCSCVIWVEVACFKIQLGSSIQHLPQGRLSQAVARNTEQSLHMKVYKRERKMKAEKKNRMERHIVSNWVDTRGMWTERRKKESEWNERGEAVRAKCFQINYWLKHFLLVSIFTEWHHRCLEINHDLIFVHLFHTKHD